MVDQNVISLKRYLNEDIIDTISVNVFLCQNEYGQSYIIKRVKTNGKVGLEDSEVNAYRKLVHKYIVSMLDYKNIGFDKYMSLEYIDGNDLYRHMENRSFKPIPEKDVKKLMGKVLKGLEYCHNNGVIHRDVKLENLILTKNSEIKIIDFEFCCFVKNCCDEQILNCGTIGYNSPQILFKKPYAACSTDVWSFGVTIYALIYGEMPFSPNQLTLLKNIESFPQLDFPDEKVSSSLKDLLTKMLTISINDRIHFSNLKNHNWFKKTILSFFLS